MVKPLGLLSNRYKLEDVPDLTGKVAVVTGGSRGIGEALVKALVQKNCEVHIIGATQSHLDEAVTHFTAVNPDAPQLVHKHQVDLGSLPTVISFAKDLASSLTRLDMLYLVAGIGVAPHQVSPEGLGIHYVVNYLSGLILVDQLVPILKKTSEGNQNLGENEGKFSTRIVIESSELHRAAPTVHCDDVEEFNNENEKALLYNRSKLFDIYLARELARRLPPLDSPTPIIVTSVHPGAVATEQQHGATESYGAVGKVLEAVAPVLFMDQEQGAESTLWAGTGLNVGERREEVHGGYFSEADGKAGTESKQAQDQAIATKLWKLSEKTLKDKVDYELSL